ncbi:MAG: hypothetical protein NTX82_07335 [Candidatus Parcubacteria bacterium]|nr:hypothetical protein [Candidatus Parcubacteria bacterium]
MGKAVRVKISELKKDIYVRVQRDEDRVYMFFCLLIDGAALPPIKITKDFQIIDGRHRVEAHEQAEKLEIEAEIIEVKNPSDFIVEAYRANIGGSLPPSKEDTEHTIRMLLELKVPRKKICELLALPSELGAKYVDTVQSRIARQRLNNAADAVTGRNLTIAQAAEECKIDPDRLKDFLSGRKKRKSKTGVPEMKAMLTTRYRGIGVDNGKILSKLRKMLGDSDISLAQATEVLEHLKKLQVQSDKKVKAWEDRFKAAHNLSKIS